MLHCATVPTHWAMEWLAKFKQTVMNMLRTLEGEKILNWNQSINQSINQISIAPISLA